MPGFFANLRNSLPGFLGGTRPSAYGFRYFSAEAPAGEVVTPDNALSVSTILACVRVLSETMAALPIDVKQESRDVLTDLSDADEVRAILEILNLKPNSEQTAYEVKIWLLTDALLRRAGYAQIVRNLGGDIIEVWPLDARFVIPYRAGDGSLWFQYNDRFFKDSEIFRFQAFPAGGLICQSIIELQGGALGAAKAANDSAAEYLGNAAQLSGVIEMTGELSDEQFERIKADFKANYSGKGKRHGVPFLEGGMKFNQLTLNAQESQLLETRKFDRSTIAGIFRVPSHKINDLEKATFSNIEWQGIAFVQDAIVPLATNLEQRMTISLLSPDQIKRRLGFKFNTDSLLKGDLQSTITALSAAVSGSLMAPNEARRKLGLPPVVGGEQLFIQGAMRPVTQPYKEGATPVAAPAKAPAPVKDESVKVEAA